MKRIRSGLKIPNFENKENKPNWSCQFVFSKMNLEEVEMQDVLSTASIEINDNNTYKYYFYPGIPHKIEAVRESLIEMAGEKGKRIDKTLIELVYYE